MKWSHSTTELLGIGVRHCSLKDALDNVWHVLVREMLFYEILFLFILNSMILGSIS